MTFRKNILVTGTVAVWTFLALGRAAAPSGAQTPAAQQQKKSAPKASKPPDKPAYPPPAPALKPPMAQPNLADFTRLANDGLLQGEIARRGLSVEPDEEYL